MNDVVTRTVARLVTATALTVLTGSMAAAQSTVGRVLPDPAGPTPSVGQVLSDPAEQAAAAANAPYILQRGDDIEIKAYNLPELNQAVRIRPDGKISMVLLNDVQAAGLTPEQLGEQLSAAFKQYYANPRVSVIVRESAGLTVYVGGEVLKPGLVPLRKETTAMQAVFESGGLKETSLGTQVRILRTDDQGVQRTISLNADEVLANRQPDVPLRPSDIVYVPKSNISVYVGGEVLHPGLLPINGELTAMAAVFQAGGMKDTAKTNTVILVRNSGSPTPQVTTLKLSDVVKGKPDTLLQPFDVLYVPRSKIAQTDRFIDQYIRQMIPFILTGGFTYLIGGTAAVVR